MNSVSNAVQTLTQNAGSGVAGMLKMAGSFAIAQLGVQTLMSAFGKLEQFAKQAFASLENLEREVRSVASIMQANNPAMVWKDATAAAEGMIQTARRLGAEIGAGTAEADGFTRTLMKAGVNFDLMSKQGQDAFQAILLSAKSFSGELEVSQSFMRNLSVIMNRDLGAGQAGGGVFTAWANALIRVHPEVQAISQEWNKQGILLVEIAARLGDISSRVEDIKMSSEAARTQWEYWEGRVLQAAFLPALKGVGDLFRDLTGTFIQNNELTAAGTQIVQGQQMAWSDVYTVLKVLIDAFPVFIAGFRGLMEIVNVITAPLRTLISFFQHLEEGKRGFELMDAVAGDLSVHMGQANTQLDLSNTHLAKFS